MSPQRSQQRPIQLGIVMDPIDAIRVYKDSSFAMLLAAQTRGWEIHYFEQGDLWCRDGDAVFLAVDGSFHIGDDFFQLCGADL